MIRLPYGGRNAQFDENDLIRHIRESSRDYIIQGQQNCKLADHTKEHSLDYWLRINYAANPDTKQAVNEVINDLIATELFEAVRRLRCPGTGNLCKGLRLKPDREV